MKSKELVSEEREPHPGWKQPTHLPSSEQDQNARGGNQDEANCFTFFAHSKEEEFSLFSHVISFSHRDVNFIIYHNLLYFSSLQILVFE